MFSSHHTDTTLECRECGKTATLVAIVPGEDGNAAHHVFKCQNCGFFNWIDEARPRPEITHSSPLAHVALR